MDGRKSARVYSLSKLTTIEQLRERLVEEFGADPERLGRGCSIEGNR